MAVDLISCQHCYLPHLSFSLFFRALFVFNKIQNVLKIRWDFHTRIQCISIHINSLLLSLISSRFTAKLPTTLCWPWVVGPSTGAWSIYPGPHYQRKKELTPPLLRSLLPVRERSGLVFLGNLALLWSSVRSGGRRCVEVSLSVADRHLLFALWPIQFLHNCYPLYQEESPMWSKSCTILWAKWHEFWRQFGPLSI